MEMQSITHQMNTVREDLELTFKNLYTVRDLEQVLELLIRDEGESNYYDELFRLRQMLASCGIDSEPDRSIGYYQQLIRQSNLPKAEELEDAVFLELLHRFESFPAPENFLLRIVNRQEDPKDGWQKDSLRLRILKQFVKYCHSLTQSGVGGNAYLKRWAMQAGGQKKIRREDLADLLTEEVFEVLDTATEEQKKSKGNYGLLKMVDDLAQGQFRINGASRRSLYLFGIAYNLTFYYGEKDSIPRYETDFRKLFGDWYNNNLMRFLRPENDRSLSGGLENDPTGQTINYSNYAEMIYLYCMVHPGTPVEKLERAAGMLEQIRTTLQEIRKALNKKTVTRADVLSAKKAEQPARPAALPAAAEQPDSIVYRKNVEEPKSGTSVLNLPQEEFVEYLLENYECDAGSRNPFVLQDGQKTAYQWYTKALGELKNRMEQQGRKISECNYGLWFTDVSSYNRPDRKSLKERWPGEDPGSMERFCRIAKRMNDCIGYTVEEMEQDHSDPEPAEKGKAVSSRKMREKSSPSGPKLSQALPAALKKRAGEVTRSSLLAVYYYLYNCQAENDGPKNLNQVYTEFCDLTREALEQCGYQPISSKSLFDLMLVASSYCYIQ